MIDLDAIRKREIARRSWPIDWLTDAEIDRRALLDYVDELRSGRVFVQQSMLLTKLRAENEALRKAARKVTCERCNGVGTHASPMTPFSRVRCEDCAPLRALLKEKP